MSSISPVRGNKKSPILVIGDSLPDKETTKESILEVLDRRHLIYNSIIVPLKYYINQYLFYKKGGYCLPNDNKEDIFMYINAFEKSNGKKILDERLKEEIGKPTIKIVLCMGTDVFMAILKMSSENLHLGYRYKSNFTRKVLNIEDNQNETQILGASFKYLCHNQGKIIKGKYVLPILHNSSNTNFQNTYEFVPDEKRDKYNYKINNKQFIIYFQYIAEEIGNIMLEVDEIRNHFLNKYSI